MYKNCHSMVNSQKISNVLCFETINPNNGCIVSPCSHIICLETDTDKACDKFLKEFKLYKL